MNERMRGMAMHDRMGFQGELVWVRVFDVIRAVATGWGIGIEQRADNR